MLKDIPLQARRARLLQDALLPFRAAAQQKVLLVDDDPISLEILALMLGCDGHEVRSVRDGQAALNMLQAGEDGARPDVLLVDMHMPGISAGRLAERVRAMHGPRPVLLAMSATRMGKGQLHGFDGFLQKPLTIEDLRVALQTRSLEASPAKGIDGAAQHGPGRRAAGAQRGLSEENGDARRRAAAGATQHRKQAMDRAATEAPVVNSRANSPALDQAAIDPAVVAKLSRAMPPMALKELYAACVADSRLHAKIIEELARSRRLEAIPPEAHRIKGAALMVGATRLASAALSLERGSCKSEDPLPLVAELHRALDSLERILQADELGKANHDCNS